MRSKPERENYGPSPIVEIGRLWAACRFWQKVAEAGIPLRLGARRL